MAILNKSTKAGVIFLLLLYLLLLTRSILFKKSPGYYRQYFRSEYKRYSVKEGLAKGNTVLFATIKRFYKSRHLSAGYKQDNLLGNLLGFLPFGFMVPLLLPFLRRFFWVLLCGFLLSCFYEGMQLYFGLGIFDVDDLLLNTAGTVTGYVLFRIARWLYYHFLQQETSLPS